MRKLTNAQMDILAERVVDLIEEAGKLERDKIIKSKEYIEWENNFKDPNLDFIKANLDKIAEYNKQINKLTGLNRDAKDAITRIADEAKLNYNYYNLEEVPSRFIAKKKAEAFGSTIFERDKMLRKVKADILLSDVDNPDELVKSLVEKLK